MSKYISYEQSGVDIEAGEQMVEQIQGYVASTFGPRVMGLKGGFAGMFRLDYDERLFKRNYKHPVLVACTDGVGSKVQLAGQIKKFDTVGIDLVAMNVNDMLVQGAEPLFFLDYLAVHKLEPKIVAELVKGVAAGCKLADCALIGGETAEMPDTYRVGDFDMAGFAVGIVERKKIITGKNIRKGDCILGLASSGLHSNGYTLARNICFKKAGLKMTDTPKELGGAVLGDVLLEPTRIYVRAIVKLLRGYKVKRIVHGMAHITGGGLVGNIPRVLPKDCDAVIKKTNWPGHKIFTFLQNKGPVEEAEMFRVFNMGIGFVLIVAEDFADSIAKKLTRYGEKVYKIGRITGGTGKVVFKEVTKVSDMERLYAERLKRYVTAMRNEKPDKVPIRPFVAEFTAKYAGYTIQEVTFDLEKALAAARKCAADFDWDAVVPNMVHVWAGLTEAIGLRYYAYPGIQLPADTCFQYREPPEDKAFMKPDEYDQLIEDPTGYLFNVWFPRVCGDVSAEGQPTSYRNNMSFLKGGMAMMSCFNALGKQTELLRTECGTVSAISGILKAPLDIITDKLRGYLGMCTDLYERPDKVLAACEAFMPHLLHMALSGADSEKNVPIAIWMHRGCVPFVSHEHFDKIYWPTLKPIVEEIWARGHQVLFYAEGRWAAHLEAFAELPDQSIIFHVDQDDVFEVHKAIGHKFCISGGIGNFLLSYGTAEQVRDYCKKVIDTVARDGGYIMDASAIIQDDTSVENLKAMTEFTREYGVY